MAPDLGDVAPDFTLVDHTGEAVTLSRLRGAPVVLVFFPKAFTGTCTGELCALRDELAIFEGADADVLAISCDTTASLAVFAEQQRLPFRLLSDFWPHGEVARAYGAFLEERGYPTRATVVVDRDGRVAAQFRVGPAEARDLAAYREALALVA